MSAKAPWTPPGNPPAPRHSAARRHCQGRPPEAGFCGGELSHGTGLHPLPLDCLVVASGSASGGGTKLGWSRAYGFILPVLAAYDQQQLNSSDQSYIELKHVGKQHLRSNRAAKLFYTTN
ncbi:hypothetical protein UPYG_G00129600 [Umbra pygmaea]|uniref:Uncharacterized protein n=1 Tax=Umbra pygmaea TaxID=75934 RepID=A0ABD0X7I0_UMBPY